MKNKNALLGFVIILILWLTGCNNKNEQILSTGEGFLVKVQKVEFSKEDDQDYYIGIVEESVSVPVSFLTIGQVEKVYVTEGQKITKGQLLAVLNNNNYKSMYEIAFAKEKQADDAYNRLSDLYKKGSLPEIKYIEIQTGVDQALSATQIALKNMDDCKLYAPMDGIIGTRSIEPGMSVMPGISVFKLVKIDKVFIKVSVPENEISKIKTGNTAKISVTALNNEQFEGTIEEKGVMASPLSHTYDIKIALSNPEEKLMPGMVCKVAIHNNTSTNQVVVPSNVVQIDKNGQQYLFIAEANTNTVIKKFVKVGSPYRNGVIIMSGLQIGDQVIVEGYQKVSENGTIQIVK
jgi:membrane fusion protein, multidrug efflux system